MRRGRGGLTLVELLVVLVVIGLLMALVDGGPYAVLWCLVPACVAVTFAVVVAVRGRRKACLIACAFACSFLIPVAIAIPSLFPTYFSRLDGAHYQNAELATVLTDIAVQKQDAPYWRFYVPQRLAHAKVNVQIPQDCSLGEALDLVASAGKCQYDWHWHSMFSNRPPICAAFCFRSNGTKPEDLLIVDRYGILGE
jgi:prepilin-type N-terminal cleavage/methylation domain-containing protein